MLLWGELSLAAARGCPIEGGTSSLFLGELLLRGAACSIERGRRLFLGQLPLRGAA